MPQERGLTPLRVAVDAHNLLHDWRGIARYAHAILVRLAQRDDITLTLLTHRHLFARRDLARVLGTDRFATARVVPRDADVVWHPWNGTFFASARPAVVTFHDAVPFAFPNPDPDKDANDRAPWLESARTATRVLANSAFTAAEVERYLGVAADRITVTHLAVEPAIFRADGEAHRLADGRPYVLFVGADEPRKNLATLAAAHARAFPANDVALVVAGGTPSGEARAIAAGALAPRDLARWYRGALAVAVPSWYEGFGFPVLEAMACGAPVLASRASSLPEVGGAAPLWLEEPLDVGGWSDALRSVAGDAALRARLRDAGLARAAAFSWDDCAQATFDVLRVAALQPA